jgi:hypothetical protein
VAGRDPYAEGPDALPGPFVDAVDPVWRGAPAPYGPVWLELAGLAVRLTGGELVAALLVLRGLAALGLALTAWALLRLARDPARALWLGIANPLVLLHLLAGGHNDALMVGLLVAGLAVARGASGRAALVVAGVLVTLAGLVKLPALLGLAHLPLLVGATRRDRARAAAVVAGTAAVTALAVTAATGLGWGWLGALDAGRARLSLSSPLTGLGTAVGALDAVLAAGLAAAGLLAALLWVAASRPGSAADVGGARREPGAALRRGEPVQALGLTLLVGALLLPVVQPWYPLWGVVLLAAVTGPRAAAALGALCLVLCLAVGPDGRHVVRPPLYGLSTVLALAVAALVLRRSSSAPDLVAPEPAAPAPPAAPEAAAPASP